MMISSLFGLIHLSTSGNRQEMSDLFEAFFRYKFQYNRSGAQASAEAYFLEIKGKDPSPEFMTRFAEHSPPIKKGSEWIPGSLIQQNNGLLFRIDGFEWIGLGWFTRDHVRIWGGYDESSLSSSSAYYIWKRDKKGWGLVVEGPVLLALNNIASNK